MATDQLSRFLTHLRSVMVQQDARELSDAALLRRYVRDRDEAAFEVLVRKHGPMVLGVCRRILSNPHDAEDAFQATWLVLVRKAAVLRSPGTVGNWLYGVAYRTALEAKKLSAKRRAKEAKVTPSTGIAPDAWNDLRPVLDHELERLADKHRAVVVLCDLEGKTRKEAARQLGLPEGTVTSRLATARRTLARRLSRHGLPITGVPLASLLWGNARAGVPPSLVSTTIRAAHLLAAGQATGQISTSIIALTEGVLRTMLLAKLKITSTLSLLAVLIAGGIGVSVHRTWAACAVDTKELAVMQAKLPERETEGPAADRGDAGKPHVTDQPLRAGPPRVLVEHKHPVSCLGWSPDGRWIAAATQDGAIHVTEVATGKEGRAFSIGGATTILAFAPDGKRLAVRQPGQPSSIWMIDTGKEQPSAGRAGGNFGPAEQVAFTPDGQYAVSVAVGQIERSGASGGGAMLMGNPGGGCAAIAPNGAVGGWCDAKGNLRIFQFANPLLRPEKTIQVGNARCIAFAPGGKLLAVGVGDSSVQLWDLAASKKTLVLTGLGKTVGKLSFSADGRTLAVLAADGQTIQLWDTARGRARCKIDSNSGAEWLALSPDGKMLAMAAKGGKEIFLWKVSARQLTPATAPLQLTAPEMTALWADLASPDADKADAAWRKLAAAGDNAVPFIRQKIRAIAVPAVALQPIEKLVSELDSEQFTAREQATKKLLATGELAIVPLQRHLEKGLSMEAAKRVQQVLDKLGQPALTPDRLRVLQAIELLEALRSANAIALLEEMVRHALVPQIRGEARHALQRLAQSRTENK